MEHRRNDARKDIEGGDRSEGLDRLEIGSDDSRRGEDDGSLKATAGRGPVPRDSVPKRDATSWVNWQSALYVFVLGAVCLVLVPLTSFWWIILVLGAVVPLALAVLERPDLRLRRPDDRKSQERELLHALAEWGEVTLATAAMQTSLTVDEASKMLEELACKGHLRPWADEGIVSYALRERDRHELPGKVTAPLEAESDGAPQQLDDPLSERELEVLTLLASGRTNSEIARDLFVSLGTVKSHTGNIYRKLDAKNRAEALTRARELNLIS
jgi:DNA-binding CsgD family transcriptional regulator